MRIFSNFEEFLNQYRLNESEEKSEEKSEERFFKSINVISSYINKETGLKYKRYPFAVTHIIEGEKSTGIMLYSDMDESAIKITKGSYGSVVSSMEYFSKHYSNKIDFQISSDTFPITKLLNEFIRLMTDDKYNKSVNESIYNNDAYKVNEEFDDSTVNEIEGMLDENISALQISKKLDLPYNKILKLRKELNSIETVGKAETKNKKSLQDKVKILDEIMEDIYDISRKVGAGAFNSLFISGRAGTGKTFNVNRALTDEGLIEGEDFIVVSGAASVIMIYKTLHQFNGKTIVFDDCDSVFKDQTGRNLFKAALDTKKERKISYLKKNNMVYDAVDLQDKPEEEYNALESGLVPNRFDFTGRVIFVSNLTKKKADPDGAIRSRSILIDVAPDDMTLMERLRLLLPKLEPVDMPLEEKEEIFDFLKGSKNISMRTFVKAAGFKTAGLKNWKRMTERYV